MDTGTVNHWRGSIKKLLAELAAIPFPDFVKVESKTVFDEKSDNYMVVMDGWEGADRTYGCLIHIEIKGDKVWIQQDGTEYGMAGELVAAGIPKDHIVLGFKSPRMRPHTGYAVA